MKRSKVLLHVWSIYLLSEPLVYLRCSNGDHDSPFLMRPHFHLPFFPDMSRNKLVELPVECTEFEVLERLVLYHNTIKGIPETVACLQSLQFLDLR